jgi:hypothetical protein
MAMTKIVDPCGWDFDRPITVPVLLSSRGLVGQDRRDQLKSAKDEVPVHNIALGATEAYGSNRNGDGFRAETCRNCHDTFVKYARWYRNHANKDKAKSYGYIKASCYNEDMRRVELLCMLNASKEAAERNGGLVADQELEKLAKHEDLATSMACRVDHDECSNCHNHAKTREEYCTESSCVGEHGEKRGGCRNNLTKVGEDGHVLHVDNPNPHFFDNSTVWRPADRIAYGTRADYLQKAASHQFTPGALLAEQLGVTAPFSVCLAAAVPEGAEPQVAQQIKLACALALAEQTGGLSAATYRSFEPAVCPPLSQDQFAVLGALGTEKAAAALTALADQKIILPLRDFATWLHKEAAVVGAAACLPGIYSLLVERGNLDELIVRNPFTCTGKQASAAQRVLANQLVPTHALVSGLVCERAMRACLKSASAPAVRTYAAVKTAGDNLAATQLAGAYALYQLAALQRITTFDRDFNLTASLAIGQNRV